MPVFSEEWHFEGMFEREGIDLVRTGAPFTFVYDDDPGFKVIEIRDATPEEAETYKQVMQEMKEETAGRPPKGLQVEVRTTEDLFRELDR